MGFFIALLEIVGIDVILSGDNAVVIALACRSLPARQQKTGVILGAGAAVVLRVLFTVFVTYLMALPFLKLGGGLLLLWIGYKLMVEEEADKNAIQAHGDLFGAIRIIVIADAVMSLDNVLAVAAAAKGSFTLLVLGLLISIPLVVYGATLMIALLKRFPFIVALGAGLIGYVGGEVMVSDPALEPWINAHAHWLHLAWPVLCAVLVIDCGRFFGPPPRPAALGGAGSGAHGQVRGAGGMALARAPLIVSFLMGVAGYAAMDHLLAVGEGVAAARTLMRAAGPFLGACIALVFAELTGRLLGLKARRQT